MSETDQDSIALDAFALVHGDRGDVYGPPLPDYQRVTDTFNALTGHGLTPAEGVLFMVCMKLGRVAHGLEEGLNADLLRDSHVDAAGYLECLWQVVSAAQDEETEEDDDVLDDEETNDDR